MLRKGPLLFLAAAVILAGLAAWGAHRWINARADQASAARVLTAPVVVAAADIEPGRKLESKDLRVINWPAGQLPAGHMSKTSQIEGRVLKTPVVKGEIILSGKLAQEGIAGGLSALVTPGYRAVTVRVDEVIGVGGFVQAGDRVDVLATVAKGNFAHDPTTKVILQSVQVLTVGEKVQEEGEGAKARRQKVTVVTLLVKPEDGERLGLAANEGRILLALRNNGDREEESTAGVNFNSLVPERTPPPPPPAPPKAADETPRVEVIKVATRVTDAPQALPQTQAAPAKAPESAGEPSPGRKPPCPQPTPAPSRR